MRCVSSQGSAGQTGATLELHSKARSVWGARGAVLLLQQVQSEQDIPGNSCTPPRKQLFLHHFHPAQTLLPHLTPIPSRALSSGSKGEATS